MKACGSLGELSEFKNISFGQVVGKCCRDELVNELGDAAEHRSKWSGVEAHDGSTRAELFLPFRQDIGVWKFTSSAQRPGVGFLEALGQVLPVGVNQVGGRSIQTSKDVGIGLKVVSKHSKYRHGQ